MEKAYPKIGVNVFVLKEGKLLLGKRIGKTGYGTWCLLTGTPKLRHFLHQD